MGVIYVGRLGKATWNHLGNRENSNNLGNNKVLDRGVGDKQAFSAKIFTLDLYLGAGPR